MSILHDTRCNLRFTDTIQWRSIMYIKVRPEQSLIPLKKPNLRRCFNFPVTATYDKYVSCLKNFAPYISGFLSGIIFPGFCSVIIP